ncbi:MULTISPECIES: SDR family oxidoreductase [Exiguobacterium]|uniref:Short-chain dehydrogenase/reductase SDR n=1 Tax=Exiguobacterium sibiricum (strain DSM 17290 / CCUG 55495 / CIP 109462 / JCM 13490 / 255-15) TaxID=262543 RepID=B1YGL2_EXIS2|nr:MULTISPECIES: SDR family oxidoreductase [Exiguobacterium]ACB61016.1 short-chain dehydrogenase/reductase SDR [Exiguobacterium sibiricum 255-15]RDB34076.1 SDR family NAD(P)-dependent oxidoreductase [Exiguobacterium sp. RIT594]
MIENKVVIITGASSGIGEATAKLLAKQGAQLVLAARREDRLKTLQQEIEQLGGKAVYQVTDVTDSAQVEQLAKLAQDTFGSVDVLVNNAGLMPLSKLNKNKQDEWNTMVDVNIKGVLYGIGAVLPYMREQKRGHIINISSVAGHDVMPSSAVYSGTKFAVRAITEGLRKEESVENNIRATIISPGAVDTELKDHITDEEIKQGIGDLKAMDADAIARAIAYAVNEPDDVAVNEILIRPTAQQ